MFKLSNRSGLAKVSASMLGLFAAGCAHNAGSGEGADGRATLELTMVMTEPGGAVMVALFDSADAYDGNGAPVRGARVAVTSTNESAVFKGLPPGEYAVRAYHDQNSDGTLNTNPLGAPLEPFAFSNGAIVQYGPPAFDDAALDLKPGSNEDTLRFGR
ncbi:MAG: DUF2141 domain-containing protein [Pseudomonadota bacterium]